MVAKPKIVVPPVPTTVKQIFDLIAQMQAVAQPDVDALAAVLKQTPFETLLPSAKAGKIMRMMVRCLLGQKAV